MKQYIYIKVNSINVIKVIGSFRMRKLRLNSYVKVDDIVNTEGLVCKVDAQNQDPMILCKSESLGHKQSFNMTSEFILSTLSLHIYIYI